MSGSMAKVLTLLAVGAIFALVNTINVYEILRHDAFILTQDAVRQVEEVYA